MKYKLIEDCNLKLIFKKCEMTFDFNLEPYVNKNTRELIINDDNYYKILEIIQDFLAPLNLIEEVNDNEC